MKLRPMSAFHAVLVNASLATITNTFVWFAVTFWVYLETRSVIATSVMAGIFTVTVAVTGVFLGSLVDRYAKKAVMLASSVATLASYLLAYLVLAATPEAAFKDHASPALWAFVVLCLMGALVGNLRAITLSTLVTVLVPEAGRDRANGLVGTANGSAFLVASIFSGLAIGQVGVRGMLVAAIVMTVLVIFHLMTVPIPDDRHSEERRAAREEANSDKLDLRGTVAAVRQVPGLFGLIFFHTFNNFLGGVYMSLMDAYGLLLVSVEVWGFLWGALSLGFIVGGLVVARRGLGPNPLRTFFQANIVMWAICCVFTLRASIVLLAIGMFIWLCLIPVVEAAEQTILQKVVTPERQGRVFGFAQSVEQAATPITAFLVGPLAQWYFIPTMTDGAGARVLGPWLGGTGTDRGLALLFTVAGVIGLAATLLSMRTSAYRILSVAFRSGPSPLAVLEVG